ncbi:Protein SAWADEE HOMEODOMAIN HOMOLOG 2 [Linum perenne]
MGRPPSNGGPAFRFSHNEVAEMEAILQQHKQVMPSREVLVGVAEKFSESPERKGKIAVQMKQVWNWFQNRRYAIRAKSSKAPAKLNITQVPRDDIHTVKNAPHPVAAPAFMHAPTNIAAPSGNVVSEILPLAGRTTPENSYMEFEAKSGRDGAWWVIQYFSFSLNIAWPFQDVLVRFSGFGPDEDEWINVRKNVRQRSLPCEASECVAVLPGDLILCFQEGKDQALYFDAHVLDAQRRRHDVRGCRCRFLVRYDHDQSEEIVPLRKVCRRPETDYRLQQLHAAVDSASQEQQQQQKSGLEHSNSGNILQRASTSATTEIMPKQRSLDSLMSVPKPPESSSSTMMNAGNAGIAPGIVSSSTGNAVPSILAPSSSS